MDLRYAFRTLWRSPGFSAVSVLSLALGIGANAAMFTIVNAILLRPLPYKDAGRLVVVGQGNGDSSAPANFLDWRAQNTVFEMLAAAEYWTPNLNSGDRPEELSALRLTAGLLPMLGERPMLGRVFTPEEEHAGRDHVAVIGYTLWKTRFGANGGIVGRTIALNGERYTIVGVMPDGFAFAPFWATKAQLWAPLPLDDRKTNRVARSLRLFARLKPGVGLDRARADMAAIAARLEAQYPGTNQSVTVRPLHERVVGDVQPALVALMVAVGLVLLIACANVAHLQLVRAAGRAREIALRAALGASRGRIVGQLMAEGAVLSAIGGVVGLALAVVLVRVLVALAPLDVPRIQSVRIDGALVAFLLAATVLAGLVFGVAPALHASRIDLNEVLKDGSRGLSDGARRARGQSVLVASEFAMALALVVAAGLILRSFFGLLAVDSGFDPRNVVSMKVSLAGSVHADPHRRVAFFDKLAASVRALPGVEAAGIINHLPLHGDTWTLRFAIEGRPIARPGEAPGFVYRVALPGYFEAMRIPIVRGRDFTASDTSTTPAVVVINETVARRHWGSEDPIGRRLTMGDPANNPVWATVVGITRDARQTTWDAPSTEEMYFPYAQSLLARSSFGGVYMTLVVRAGHHVTGAATIAAVENAVRVLDRDVAVSDVITMTDAIGEHFATPRFYVWLLSGFGGVALLLAAIGIYGVMSHAVARRTHEIGVRVALGATHGDVVRTVGGQAFRLAALGTAAGMLASLVCARYLRTLLFGVQPLDPATFLAAPLLLAAVAIVACYLPLRRATRVDPVVALRTE